MHKGCSDEQDHFLFCEIREAALFDFFKNLFSLGGSGIMSFMTKKYFRKVFISSISANREGKSEIGLNRPFFGLTVFFYESDCNFTCRCRMIMIQSALHSPDHSECLGFYRDIIKFTKKFCRESKLSRVSRFCIG